MKVVRHAEHKIGILASRSGENRKRVLVKNVHLLPKRSPLDSCTSEISILPAASVPIKGRLIDKTTESHIVPRGKWIHWALTKINVGGTLLAIGQNNLLYEWLSEASLFLPLCQHASRQWTSTWHCMCLFNRLDFKESRWDGLKFIASIQKWGEPGGTWFPKTHSSGKETELVTQSTHPVAEQL